MLLLYQAFLHLQQSLELYHILSQNSKFKLLVSLLNLSHSSKSTPSFMLMIVVNCFSSFISSTSHKTFKLSSICNKSHSITIFLIIMAIVGFYRVMTLVCIVFLFIHSEKVYAIRSMDLAIKWSHGRLFSRKDNTQFNIAPTPSPFDPYQSNKRRVRRGADPIHNRC